MKSSLFCLLALILTVESVRGACTYTSSDKKYNYDLSALSVSSGYGYLRNGGDGYNYWFNVCANLPKSNCTQQAPVCQASQTKAGQNVPTGYLPATFADGDAGTGSGVVITYVNNVEQCSGNTPRKTNLHFKCSGGAPGFLTITSITENKCLYDIYINSYSACPTSGGKGKIDADLKKMSGGSIFLIIFFVGAAVYLIVGSIVNWRVKHASGIEVIPNFELWRSIPGLMKDGFTFTKDKIMGLTGRGYQSV
eukprot:TRINITY_DN4125_c0_g2_i4.p1 TRINITY_DN4125_c0_g2~~TRINITY_DN4125_c0_g2_i4.p1  ORF type:complete len:251 (-),score=49.28 TRINITY_DN4125_c0_g2_i4:157-909(-)